LQKDGTPLPADRFSLSGGNLTITGLVEGDRGIYECSATNEAATITAEAELMIENIAPRNGDAMWHCDIDAGRCIFPDLN